MDTLKLFIGTGFGSGYLPKAPGTFGSLFALIPSYFLLQYQPLAGIIAFVIVCSLLTLWTAKACEEKWGKDPGIMVIDEFAGQALTFISIPLSSYLLPDILLLSTGFFLFRIFDIWKPFGIGNVQKIGGGMGILLDDLIAGFYAFICLKTLIFVFPNIFAIA